jgi:hypothetical protein
MHRLVERIAGTEGCTVSLPAELPTIGPPHVLPVDVREFYELCGGATLFEDSDYPLVLVPPDQVVRANPVIIGEACDEDRSASWYIVARDLHRNYITIDCSQERLGRCYDSSFDRHGIAGSCPVVATSFTDLIDRLLSNAGQHWYWLRPGFQSLGDAYD